MKMAFVMLAQASIHGASPRSTLDAGLRQHDREGAN